jgi:PE family
MSFVIAAPEFVTAAATDLASIGSTLNAAKSAAAAPTTGILAAAEDEVSAAIAAAFSAHGQGFQALGAQGQGGCCAGVAAVPCGVGSRITLSNSADGHRRWACHQNG